MSSTVDLAYKNFIWRIETINPTNSIPDKKFVHNERPLTLSPSQSSGMTRDFNVYWDSSDADFEPTDVNERVAQHFFTIEIAYTTDFDMNVLHEILLQDRHDLIKQLRDTRNFVGYSSTNTTDNIDLWARTRTREELIKDSETTWFLRQQWRCTIREAE